MSKEPIITSEMGGYEFRVILDIKKSGFLITAIKDQAVLGEKFINWTVAPMLGLNRNDQERIEETINELSKELENSK